MHIKFLGAHNCESQAARLISLLIDDCLVLDAGGLTSSLSFEAQLKLKAIVLSHHHYDHIKDIPLLAMNLYLNGASIDIYGTLPVRDALLENLLNNDLYPNFLEKPKAEPVLRFNIIEPFQTVQIEGYRVLAVPIAHAVSSIGCQITSADGKTVFYTGDTGPDLADCWGYVSPQLLIIDVTASNRFEEFGKESGHLTPGLLQRELLSFQKIRGYLPKVVVVHMNPNLEGEIEAELFVVAKELNNSITLAYEGMQLNL